MTDTDRDATSENQLDRQRPARDSAEPVSHISREPKVDDGTGKDVLEAVEISAKDLKAARHDLAQILDGRRSILPIPDAEDRDLELEEEMRVGEPIEAGTLIATTSGSTGTPKGTLLSAQNLRASARATEEFLADKYGTEPGPWLLTLPAHHIAGLQVIFRAMVAGFTPVATTALREGKSFSAKGFAEDTQALRDRFPRLDLHTSLVPAQVHDLLADPQGLAALKEFKAVLIGGAAMGDGVRKKLDEEEICYVHTYGSSETSGGMVYDGQVLNRGEVRIEDADEHGAGTIVLTGPMVARGYRNVDTAEAFPEPATFRTSDIGIVGDDGSLTVLGRSDGAINTGGLKVLPEEAEAAIQRHATIDGEALTEACVAGVDDPRWGQALVALVVRQGGSAATGTETADAKNAGATAVAGVAKAGDAAADKTAEQVEVTDQVRETMKSAGAEKQLIPQRAWAVTKLPRTGPGKVDRRAVAEIVAELSAELADDEQ